MHYMHINLLCTKDEAFRAYKAFAAWAETQHSVCIKCLHSDCSGEFTGSEFTTFLKEQGTEYRLTTHNTPQHNGIAGLLNHCLLECIHTIIHHSSLPKMLWGEVVNFTVWLKNCTSTCILSDTTPYEHLHCEKPNLAGLPKWGQHIWVHSALGSKLDACTIEARWVSFDSESMHTHCIYWLGKNSVSVEHNIKFAPTTSYITFPPLPEGEQPVHNHTQVSQQGEDLPSTTSNTTKVDPAS
jgi:hypothetical protein